MERGYFSHWNARKHFGFIVVKRPGGWLERYFAQEMDIVRKEVEPAYNVPVVFEGQKPHDDPVSTCMR